MREILRQQVELVDGELKTRLAKILNHHPEMFTVVGAIVTGHLDDECDHNVTWDIEVYTQCPSGVFVAVIDIFQPEEIPFIRDHLRLSGAIKTEMRRIQGMLEAKIDALRMLSANVEVIFEGGHGNVNKQEQSK